MNSESRAGSSVREARIEASTTSIAPAAMLRKIVVGIRNIPISANTTVSPLKNTARLAVAPAAPIAPCGSNPLRRSSRYRATMNRE